MSLSTTTPLSHAFETILCGVGYKCGIPGETIKLTIPSQDVSFDKSRILKSSASAAIRDCSLSSQTIGSAPPARKARAALKPERPRPKTATLQPVYPRTGTISVTSMLLSQLRQELMQLSKNGSLFELLPNPSSQNGGGLVPSKILVFQYS